MITLLKRVIAANPDYESQLSKIETASSLVTLVWVAWQLGLEFARLLVEIELFRRATLPIEWPVCPHCKTRLISIWFQKRKILTLVGWVKWSRRVGRCPKHCCGSQRIPFDEELLIKPAQKTSDEVIKLGCLLAIFIPFEITSQVLEKLTGISGTQTKTRVKLGYNLYQTVVSRSMRLR